MTAPMSLPVTVTVNGELIEGLVEPRTTLADFVRTTAGHTGTRLGCWHGVCGACTLLVDGELVRGCLTLAVQAMGAEVTTVEALAGDPIGGALQAAFRDGHAVQCGFCTSGMLVAATALLRAEPDPTPLQIREHLHGNLCRCTGYEQIVEAVGRAARALEDHDG